MTPTSVRDALLVGVVRACYRMGILLAVCMILGVTWTDHYPPPNNPQPVEILGERS